MRIRSSSTSTSTSIRTAVDDKHPCITFRTLNYGNYGIFLITGNAGFLSPTVVIVIAVLIVIAIVVSSCRNHGDIASTQDQR